MSRTAMIIISVAVIAFVAGLIVGFEVDKKDKAVKNDNNKRV